MKNILETEDLIKGMPDQQLFTEAKQPTGQVPQFLVISEIKRRTDMRKRYQNQGQEMPQQTVADQIVNEGLGSLAPQGGQPPQPQGAMPPQQMAEGGVVPYNTGGGTFVGGRWNWQNPFARPQNPVQNARNAVMMEGVERQPEINLPGGIRTLGPKDAPRGNVGNWGSMPEGDPNMLSSRPTAAESRAYAARAEQNLQPSSRDVSAAFDQSAETLAQNWPNQTAQSVSTEGIASLTEGDPNTAQVPLGIPSPAGAMGAYRPDETSGWRGILRAISPVGRGYGGTNWADRFGSEDLTDGSAAEGILSLENEGTSDVASSEVTGDVASSDGEGQLDATLEAVAGSEESVKNPTGGIHLQGGGIEVQSKGIASLDPSNAEQLLMEYVNKPSPDVPVTGDLSEETRNDAWSNAIVQLGAGIAKNDLAGGLSRAGTIGMAGKEKAREMELKTRVFKHQNDQAKLERDIQVLGKVAGIEAQKWSTRIQAQIQSGRDDNETIRLIKAAVDDVMKDAIIVPRVDENGDAIESMYEAKLREVSRLYDAWLPAEVKASRGLVDFVKATMQGITAQGSYQGRAVTVTNQKEYDALPAGASYIASDDPTGQLRTKP